jgi:hypothetical protein
MALILSAAKVRVLQKNANTRILCFAKNDEFRSTAALKVLRTASPDVQKPTSQSGAG